MAAVGFLGHRFRHAVRGEHDGRALRYLVQLMNEDCALGHKLFDDEAIMDDLVPDIDRAAEPLDRALDDLDGTVHPGAEAPRTGENDRQAGKFHD